MTSNQQAQEAPEQAAPTPAPEPKQIEDPLDAAVVGAYSQREFVFHEREDKGELSFEYIVNDGNPNHLIWYAACSP